MRKLFVQTVLLGWVLFWVGRLPLTDTLSHLHVAKFGVWFLWWIFWSIFDKRLTIRCTLLGGRANFEPNLLRWEKSLQGVKSWAWLPKFCRTFGVLQNLHSTSSLLCETFCRAFLQDPQGSTEIWGTSSSPFALHNLRGGVAKVFSFSWVVKQKGDSKKSK